MLLQPQPRNLLEDAKACFQKPSGYRNLQLPDSLGLKWNKPEHKLVDYEAGLEGGKLRPAFCTPDKIISASPAPSYQTRGLDFFLSSFLLLIHKASNANKKVRTKTVWGFPLERLAPWHWRQ